MYWVSVGKCKFDVALPLKYSIMGITSTSLPCNKITEMDNSTSFRETVAKKREELAKQQQQLNDHPVMTIGSKPLVRRGTSNSNLLSNKNLNNLMEKNKNSTGLTQSTLATHQGAFIPTSTRVGKLSRPTSAASIRTANSLKTLSDATSYSQSNLKLTSTKTKVDKRPQKAKSTSEESFTTNFANANSLSSLGDNYPSSFIEENGKKVDKKKDKSRPLNPEVCNYNKDVNKADSKVAMEKLDVVGEPRIVPNNSNIEFEQLISKEDFNSNLDLNFDMNKISEDGPKFFQILPNQGLIYNKVHLFPDEIKNINCNHYIEPTSFNHKIHEMFLVNEKNLNIQRLKSVIFETINNFSVLRTKLIRNDKILDADVEGFIEPIHNVCTEEVLENLSVFDNLKSKNLDILKKELITLSDLASIAKISLKKNNSINPVFKILYLENKKLKSDSTPSSFLFFISTSSILDQNTLTTFCKIILEKYFNTVTSNLNLTLHSHEEKYSFSNFSQNAKFTKVSRGKAFDFWKSQCFENFENSISDSKRIEMENQMLKLGLEHDRLKEQIFISKQKRSDTEVYLMKTKQKRLDLERGNNGPSSTFIDPTTYEMVHIPLSLRISILTKVMGQQEPQDDVYQYVQRNGINNDIKDQIKMEFRTVEEFCALTEARLSYLSSSDSKKVVNLSDRLRSLIIDELHDQKALKYNLERKINKVERELKHTLTTLHNLQRQFDHGDDLRIKISQLLNPPKISNKILPISIEKIHFEPESDAFHQRYDGISFVINTEVLNKLRQFQDYLSTLEGKTALEKNSSFEEDEGGESLLRTPSVNAVCLACFGVLLRHITGVDKFLIGLVQDYRKNTFLGPLSDTLPIKIDLSEKDKTFNSLVLQLWTSLKKANENGLACPSLVINENLNYGKLPIQFEFVNFSTVEELKTLGISEDDLLQQKEADERFQRLWSINETEPYDLKLKIIDLNTELRCIFSFKTDIYSAEKVVRWAEKFENSLYQIEYGARKLTVSSIISRLYNRVWQGSTQSMNNLNASLLDLSM
ncbi:hypothetical protein HDU92_005546 [Lobulomyces angularis]|nr:hypothetical protein HDU92_005546 [Lobulomyces angularis]